MAEWTYTNRQGSGVISGTVSDYRFFGAEGQVAQWAIVVRGTTVGASDEVAVDLAALGVPPLFTITLLDAYVSSGTIQPKVGTAAAFAGFDDKVSTAAAAQRVANVQPYPIFFIASPRYLYIRPVTSVSATVDIALTLVSGHQLRGT